MSDAASGRVLCSHHFSGLWYQARVSRWRRRGCADGREGKLLGLLDVPSGGLDVTTDDTAQIISSMTGIDVGSMTEEDGQKLLGLEDGIHRRGQALSLNSLVFFSLSLHNNMLPHDSRLSGGFLEVQLSTFSGALN